MATPTIYMLIGPPGCGKSTLADLLAKRLDRAAIVSTDAIRGKLYGDEKIQGNWERIRERAIARIDEAARADRPVIYDATNCKRAWRLEFLQVLRAAIPDIEFTCVGLWLRVSVEICQQRNRERSRRVPPGAIASMAASLKAFPPDVAEGFALVADVAADGPFDVEAIGREIDALEEKAQKRANRCRRYRLHRYSALLDFERLMYLLATILRFPGIGNLAEIDPSAREEIFGKNPPRFDDPLAEIGAAIARKYGRVYGDRQEIQRDLAWLEQSCFLAAAGTDAELEPPPPSDERRTANGPYPAWHRYADADTFERLLAIVRFAIAHPFAGSVAGEGGEQERFFRALVDRGVLQDLPSDRNNLRRDIEKVLKPYGILPRFPTKRGYFAGTAILTRGDLKQLHRLLQGQKVYLKDCAAVEMVQRVQERIEIARLFDPQETYPTRALGNCSTVNPESLPERALLRHTELLEEAIEKGQLLELAIAPKSRRLPSRKQGRFAAYPLQVVFHNTAWYLGFEEAGGLLQFRRLDCLSLERSLPEQRSRAAQRSALERLERLHTASAGPYLGKSLEDQHKYLSGDRQQRQSVEMQVELWAIAQVFRFLREDSQRFPRKQMKMSRPPDRASAEEDEDLFSLPESGDRDFPYRFRVMLPHWSLLDAELKRWILGFGGAVKVVAPEALVAIVRAEALAAYQNYAPGTETR